MDQYGNLSTQEYATKVRKTLVCVTNQFECQRIIRAGRAIADLTKTHLTVLSVSSPEYTQNPQALQYLFDVSKENDAMMTVTYSENPTKTIINFIKENKVVNVLTGMPSSDDSVLYKVWNKFTHVTFFTVTPEGEIREVTKSTRVATA